MLQRHFVELTVAVDLKVAVRLEPVVGERLRAETPALGRLRLVAAMQLGRIHSDLIDLIGIVAVGEKALPQRIVWQRDAAAAFLQCVDDLLHRSANLQYIDASLATNCRP